MKTIQFPLVLCIPLVLLFSKYCFGQIDWVEIESGTNANLNAIVYGDGLFVAVGDSGTMVTSEDGLTWEKRVSGIDAQLVDIAYGNGIYIAIGDSGSIISSTDGFIWGKIESGTSTAFRSIVYGGGNFHLLRYGSSYFTSSDGIKWDSVGIPDDWVLLDLAYGNDKIAAAFWQDTILYSTNGFDWNKQYLNTGKNFPDDGLSGYQLEAIYFINNHFFATGYEYYWHGFDPPTYAAFVAISDDCATWDIFFSTYEGGGTRIRTICYGNGNYLIARYLTIYSKSEDDEDFVPRYSSSPADSAWMNSSAASGDRFVMVGNKGGIVESEWSNAVSYNGHPNTSGNSIRTAFRPGILSLKTEGVFIGGTPVELNICDTRGRTVIKKQLPSTNEYLNIPIPKLASGIYQIVIIINSNSYCTPLVVRQ
jgi:hypothetical protein